MRRVSVTDLVGPAPQRQGHDDQVAGGALDQGRARTGPIFSADLAGRAPLGQISNHAAAQGLIAVQEPLPWGGAW